jgi:cytochrome c biogenesis protein CcdA
MYIIAIAWVYVVFMMAITESSVIAGIMTFLTYCVLPLAIIFYLTGGKRRKEKRRRTEQARSAQSALLSTGEQKEEQAPRDAEPGA